MDSSSNIDCKFLTKRALNRKKKLSTNPTNTKLCLPQVSTDTIFATWEKREPDEPGRHNSENKTPKTKLSTKPRAPNCVSRRCRRAPSSRCTRRRTRRTSWRARRTSCGRVTTSASRATACMAPRLSWCVALLYFFTRLYFCTILYFYTRLYFYTILHQRRDRPRTR